MDEIRTYWQNQNRNHPSLKFADGDYTLEERFRVVFFDLAAPATLTLPEAAQMKHYDIVYIRLLSDGVALTIQRSGSDIFYKDATGAFSRSTTVQGAWVQLEHNGVNAWHVVCDSGHFS